jgi:SAM-dependent methyltransferase
MPKQGEIDYLDALDDSGKRHALNKPFSDAACGRYLCDIGTIVDLLPPPPSRLLDLGVGTGWTSVFFALRGYRVLGQDIAPKMLAMANQNRDKYGAKDLEFCVQDFESMTFCSEFDCAVFFDSLHHAEDEISALRAVFRALKPGGLCVTAEPGRGHAASPSARNAALRFGVTEKDMPPYHIIQIAQQIGFQRYEVYERKHFSRRLAAGTCDAIARPPRRLELSLRYLASALRCGCLGRRSRDPEALGLAPSTTFVDSNFVCLYK